MSFKVENWIAAVPFEGRTRSFVKPDGTVGYTKGETPEDYIARVEAEEGTRLRIVSDAKLDAMLEEYAASLVTNPTEITEEKYFDALNVLPPCRWRKLGGVETFHVSERLTRDLANWYARVGERFFTFVDLDRATDAHVDDKVMKAMRNEDV